MELDKEKKLLLDIINKAGKIILKSYKNNVHVQLKGSKDIVTNIDKEVEKLAISEIKKHFPSHEILAEESGLDFSKSEYIWIIDPIDGTNNFSRGISLFCCSIALYKKGEPVLAAIIDPIQDELFFAEKGKGAFLNNKKISVSSVSESNSAIIDLDQGHAKKERLFTKFKRLNEEVRAVRVLGTTALALAYVACGRLEAIINTSAKPWDSAAGALLILEAGGLLLNPDKTPWAMDINKKGIIASNNNLNKKLISLID